MLELFHREDGSVTVLVMCILLPMIIFEGLIIDTYRGAAARAITSDALGLSATGVLADYDRALFDSYGLFGLGDMGEKSNRATTYFQETVNPKMSGVSGTTGCVSFINIDGSVSVSGVLGTELSNENVFESQIVDYMKYNLDYSAAESQDDLWRGMDKIDGMLIVIYDKVNYDAMLYDISYELEAAYLSVTNGQNDIGSFASHMNQALDKVDELGELWSKWNTDCDYYEIPENMRSYMKEEQNRYKNLVVKSCLSGAKNTVVAANGIDGVIFDADVLYFISCCYDQNESNQVISKNAKNKANNSLATLNGKSKIYSDYADIKTLTEKSMDKDMYVVNYMRDFFTDSERSYILYGNSDPAQNSETAAAALYDYCLMWDSFENFSGVNSTYNAALAYANAEPGGSLLVPINMDVYYFNLAKSSATTISENSKTADPKPDITTYRGDENVTITYEAFMDIQTMLSYIADKSIYLARMQEVIEKNMSDYKGTTFTLGSQYTMINVSANATSKSVFSFAYNFSDNYVVGY